MSRRCTVVNVAWAGSRGGGIFSVVDDTGRRWRVVCSAPVMPRAPVNREIWEIAGVVRQHPVHGPQVEAERAILCRPSGRLIVAFLESAACPGIGGKTARKLYDALGDRIYEALDSKDSSAITAIVGHTAAQTILTAWADLNADAAAWHYCDRHGLAPRLAMRLAAIYGTNIEAKLAENPYRLLAFTSWSTADRVGRALGLHPNDPRRLVAGVEAAALHFLDQGHTATRRNELVRRAAKMLDVAGARSEAALELAEAEGAVVIAHGMIAALGAHAMEVYVAERLTSAPSLPVQRSLSEGATRPALSGLLSAFEASEGHRLNAEQRDAVLVAVQSPLSILVGGAGTGKTTALKAVHVLSEALGTPIHQAAVAGRAARRMAEATGRPARTIAGLLTAIDTGGISLDGALVVLDEASMIDLPMFYRLTRRLPDSARLMLVGDEGQLPPIGFGIVLHALVDGSAAPTTRLRTVHRQAQSTGIPAFAAQVRCGCLPSLGAYAGRNVGVSFVDAPAEEIAHRILEIRNDLREAQVVGAVKAGPGGVDTLNEFFHRALCSHRHGARGFATGEPVIWTKNDYDLGLMNGEIGWVVSTREDGIVVDFEYDRHELDWELASMLDHAYAITAHKVQGSQFRRVIMPILASRNLDRTLLYTVITRACEQVVLVGNRQAFKEALQLKPKASRRVLLSLELEKNASGYRRNAALSVAHKNDLAFFVH